MQTHSKAYLVESFSGLDPKTRDAVHARAHQLAVEAGRPSREVTQADYVQARREVIGSKDPGLSEASQAFIPQSEGWNRVPPPSGSQMEEFPQEEEDVEGSSEQAQSAVRGVEKAGDEQVRAAAKEAGREDRAETEGPAT